MLRTLDPAVHILVLCSHTTAGLWNTECHKSSKTKQKWHKLCARLIALCRSWPRTQCFGETSCFHLQCQSYWVEDICYTLPLPWLWVTTHLSLCLYNPKKFLKTWEACFNFGNTTHVSSQVFAVVWIRYLFFSSYHSVSPGTGSWCFKQYSIHLQQLKCTFWPFKIQPTLCHETTYPRWMETSQWNQFPHAPPSITGL